MASMKSEKDRKGLRLLDSCLNELEDAHERGESVLSKELAASLSGILGPLEPGMSITDAIEIVFHEQGRYLARANRAVIVEDGADEEGSPDPGPATPSPRVLSGRLPGASPWPAGDESLVGHANGADAGVGGASRSLLAHPARGPMDRAEARAMTDRIRTATRRVCVMLYEVHERRAWIPLGYPNWERYVQAEFGISRSRSYELLDQAKVILDLQATAGIDELPDVSAYVAMQIKPRLSQIREELRRQVREARGEDVLGIVTRLVEEHRQLVARGRRLVRQRRAELRRAGEMVCEDMDEDRFSQAIDVLAAMAVEGWTKELLDTVEAKEIQGVESAVRWLGDLLDAWKQKRRPAADGRLVLLRSS